MNEIIKRINSLLDFITLKHPGSGKADKPYAAYEYATVPFFNRNEILFTVDIVASTAAEVEGLAIQVRKALNDFRYSDVEVAFNITTTPGLATVYVEDMQAHVRRVNFTIIAYFKED